MKKLILCAICAFLSFACFAKSSHKHGKAVVTTTKNIPAKQNAEYPVTIITSCDTWSVPDWDCDTLSSEECINYMNDVGDLMESMC